MVIQNAKEYFTLHSEAHPPLDVNTITNSYQYVSDQQILVQFSITDKGKVKGFVNKSKMFQQ